MLAVRLTRPYAELETVIGKIAEHSDQLITFEHRADARVSRTHVHILVDGLKVSTETIKNWLRSDGAWPRTWAKTDWTFKRQYKNRLKQTVPVDAAMITYMAKGSLEPSGLVKGFANWKQLAENWIEPRKIQTTLDPKEEEGSNQVTQWQMLDEVERRLKYDENGDLARYTSNTERIVDTIIAVHLLHRKFVTRYKVRDFYDTYMARTNRQYAVSSFISLINKV